MDNLTSPTANIKEEIHSDGEEMNSRLEICKTECIYDENKVNTAERMEDYNFSNDLQKIKYELPCSSTSCEAIEIDSFKKNVNLKEETYSDSELQDNEEIKCLLEVSKTEFIYDENIVKTAERLEDNTNINGLQRNPYIEKTKYESHFENHQNMPEEQETIDEIKDCTLKEHICKICFKSFGKIDRLYNHLKVHTGERPFECSFCDKKYKHKKDLTNHQNMHLDNSTSVCEYKCKFCSNIFKRSSDLKTHLKVHNSHHCEFCSKSFAQKAQLLRHLRCHTGEKPFFCSFCKKQLKDKRSVIRHQKLHSNDFPIMNEKHNSLTIEQKQTDINCFQQNIEETECSSNTSNPINVEECPDDFDDNIDDKYYNVSMLVDNIKEDFLSDDESSNESQSETEHEQQMLQHKYIITKKHVCKFCSKRFRKAADLLTHFKVHTKEGHFPCSLCDKTYKCKQNLTKHWNNRHNLIREIVCKFCSKHFSKMCDLRVHLLKHFYSKIKNSNSENN